MKEKKKGVRKLEKGNATDPQNRVSELYLEGDVRTKTLYLAIDLLKSGLTKAIVKEIISGDENCTLTEIVINEVIDEAIKEISDQYVTKNDQLIGLHLERYNREVTRLLNKDYSVFGPALYRKIKSSAFMDVLDTLHQKEKLLQLHSKQTIVRFNQRNSININDLESKFDLDELDFDEKRRLVELLLKSKVKDGEEVVSVILNDLEEKTIDADYEEVIETPETVNIAKIERLEQDEQIDIVKPKVSLDDIKKKLTQALEKAAEKELIKAGSKTVRGESGDL